MIVEWAERILTLGLLAFFTWIFYLVANPGFDLGKITLLLHFFGFDLVRIGNVAARFVAFVAVWLGVAIWAGLPLTVAFVTVVASWAIVRAGWIMRPDRKTGRIPPVPIALMRWRIKARRRYVFGMANAAVTINLKH